MPPASRPGSYRPMSYSTTLYERAASKREVLTMGSSKGRMGHTAWFALLLVTVIAALLSGGCTRGDSTTSEPAADGTGSAGTSSTGDGSTAGAETTAGDQGVDSALSLLYPLDSLDEVITTALPGATIGVDATESSDGRGSLRITCEEPATVSLVETGDLDIEAATLFYRAKLRAEGLRGRAYLEMWCTFPDLGEYFSRGLDQPVEGTTNWVSVQTPFLLEVGQNPDNVKLNVVVDGPGTVWIDALQLDGVPSQ
jgi:hypothetical protein